MIIEAHMIQYVEMIAPGRCHVCGVQRFWQSGQTWGQVTRESFARKVRFAEGETYAVFGEEAVPPNGQVSNLADNMLASTVFGDVLSVHEASERYLYYEALSEFGDDDVYAVEQASVPCVYRYMCVDPMRLLTNLDGDLSLAPRATSAWFCASVFANPVEYYGRPAFSPPCLIMMTRRDTPTPLFEAYRKPPVGGGKSDNAIAALDRFWPETDTTEVKDVALFTVSRIPLPNLDRYKINGVGPLGGTLSRVSEWLKEEFEALSLTRS